MRISVDGAIGREQEETGRLAPGGEQRQEVHRRGVAPVEVFEDEDERDLGGERLDELGHLAEHPLAGGAQELATEPVAVVLFDEPGELREPGRRVAAQQRPGLSAPARQATHRLEHGHVGFGRAELLETLAAGDRHALVRPRRG